ncbi:hypothetical protein ESCO_005611 [Escovopsis weberi]|uniref:Uncharacterized protein n=1 Tax=Escovopsis weberi TaxID=150374 RepID=A0A0M8N4S7_ESCWE|nr:hypothetical protein ESCO_005611 [Escovopsis weberi]
MPHATSKSAGANAPRLSRIPGETPEQRVKRLRQAHLAAQKAQISRADKIVDASRRFLDVAHRWTVGGLVAFTAVAGVVSVYSVWDMLRYNRARRAEFLEAQKKYQDDVLATARLAYLKGAATEEQILLVEEANRDAETKGVKLPPLLSPPEHRTHFEEHVQPAFQLHSKMNKAAEGQAESTGRGILGLFFGGGDGDSKLAAAGAVQDAAWEGQAQAQRTAELEQPAVETSSGQARAKKGWWPF